MTASFIAFLLAGLVLSVLLGRLTVAYMVGVRGQKLLEFFFGSLMFFALVAIGLWLL